MYSEGLTIRSTGGAKDSAPVNSALGRFLRGEAMRRKILLVALLFSFLFLTNCARSARLYPVDASTASEGVLEATFMAYGTGNGSIEITMPDGEVVRGEYSIVRGGTIGFGNILATVYGPGGSASASAFGSSYAMQGASPGTASALGNKGTTMQCELYNDNWSGHGYGACRSSKGKYYRLQY